MNASARFLQVSVVLCCIGVEGGWLHATGLSARELEATREELAEFKNVHGITMPWDLQVTFGKKREHAARVALVAKDLENRRRIEGYWKNPDNKTVLRWCSAAYCAGARLTASNEVWEWVQAQDKNEFNLFIYAVLYSSKIGERIPTQEETKRLKSLLNNHSGNVRHSSLWTLLLLGVPFDGQELAKLYKTTDPGMPKDLVMGLSKGFSTHTDLNSFMQSALVSEHDLVGRWAALYVADWGDAAALAKVQELKTRAESGELDFSEDRVGLLKHCLQRVSREGGPSATPDTAERSLKE